jgi:RNA recognition motif-containing protein
MSSRVYVGRMSHATTEESVRSLFAGFDVVGVHVVTNHATGFGRGFAFVELAGDLDAARAVALLDGAALDGHFVVLSDAPDVRLRGHAAPLPVSR